MNKLENFQHHLAKMTKPSSLCSRLDDDFVQCHACAHQCKLQLNQFAICKLRFNQQGDLMAPVGYVSGLQLDPVEKKPFNHFLPGALTLSFGMVGCNFKCDFCQNWLSAQALNDPSSRFSERYIHKITPQELVQTAKNNRAQIIVSTYNEPLITTEWSIEIFEQAHAQGLHTAFVSNGFGTRQGIEALAPHLDALKIDLKAFTETTYRELGGHLQPVLETIQIAREMGIWVEIVTLLIPEMNDSQKEIWELTRFLAGVSADIPWHVTAFHPDYKMMDRSHTTATALQTAAEIGQEAGLRYVYAGNLPGRVGSLENTYCPHCQQELITRRGFFIGNVRITEEGNCPTCGEKIAGVFPKTPWQHHYPTMV